MKNILIALLLIVSVQSSAREIVRIEIGQDYNKYSERETKERIWKLEQAVWQLQQEVFKLKEDRSAPPLHTWACTIKAMGETYTKTGPTKAVATAAVVDDCKAARNGDGFFCKNPVCEE